MLKSVCIKYKISGSTGSYIMILYCLIILLIQGCRKDDVQPVPSLSGNRLEHLADSVYLYAKGTHLWNDALPEYDAFNPRQYVSAVNELEGIRKELYAIAQFKINPSTGKPYEYKEGLGNTTRYSFAEAGSAGAGRVGTISLEGSGNDFGFEIAGSGDDVRICYVNPGSPAYDASLTRGMKLISINGELPGYTAINNALIKSTAALLIQKSDNTSIEVVLNKRIYSSSPVLKTSILNNQSGKAGYLAIARFSSIDNARADLDKAFALFAAEQVGSLIVDMRYNTGGYIETAEYLVNLIAPQNCNGAIMYTEHFNALMQSGKASVLRGMPYYDANGQPVYINGKKATYADVDYSIAGNTFRFNKKGALTNLQNIVFIVGRSTASASELVINSLVPYMSVKLVGARTYGKPVGFFGIGIDNYTIYIPQFQIRNSKGTGDYFDGMVPDAPALDDITHDLGDPAEICLSNALALAGGRIPPGNGRLANRAINDIIIPASINGLIEKRYRLKK